MTKLIQSNDKIFQMFKQYRTLLERDKTVGSHGRDTHLVASQLTLAHMVDHLVCILKDDEKPTVHRISSVVRKNAKTGRRKIRAFWVEYIAQLMHVEGLTSPIEIFRRLEAYAEKYDLDDLPSERTTNRRIADLRGDAPDLRNERFAWPDSMVGRSSLRDDKVQKTTQ